MRYRAAVPFAVLALLAVPAGAREPEAPAEKPLTDRTVGVEDVATTPVKDLNLKKDKIPQILIDAQARPYDLSGLGRCAQLTAAVDELDVLLGEDFDLPVETAQRGPSAGRMAQSVVGSFIPFRGVIRELSGANEQDRRLQSAIQAGIARRSFLKGVGQTRGCRYPARAATKQDIQAYETMLARREATKDEQERPDKGEDR